MVITERKTSRSYIRAYLKLLDNILAQYRLGHMSQNEATAAWNCAFGALELGLRDCFLAATAAGAFFRDPTPDHDGDASPAEPSDG